MVKIEIERSIDVVAVIALILSLITGAVQLADWLKGTKLVLLPTEQVLITSDHYDYGDYVRFVTRMSYINKGHPGYSSVIQREIFRYWLSGRIHEQAWQLFATFDYGKSGLEVVNKVAAHP